MQHGCLLALYLFLRTADVLGKMLDDETYGIEGLVLPLGKQIINQMFADDTTIYLKGSKKNLGNIMASWRFTIKCLGLK